MRSALLALGLLALAGCRGGESDKPPVHLIPNMDSQEKGRPYRADTSGVFADGRMMRTPVEGTVAIGQLDEDDLLVEGHDADGGMTTVFPSSIKGDDPEVIARGKLRFNIYCAPCHGVTGDGKGPVATRGLVVPPANFLDERLKAMPVGQMYSAIKNGVNNFNMPSYAAQIPVEDRWKILAYVRAKEGGLGASGGVALAVMAKPDKPTLEYGQYLYKAKTCNTCHSLDGTRIVGPSFKGAYGRSEKCSNGESIVVDDAYIKESIATPMARVVEGFPPAMPVLKVDDFEVESLILFIKAQK